ncbi:MAG: hypothetical protein ACON5C_09020 [Alphaproteobacteria bacterium]
MPLLGKGMLLTMTEVPDAWEQEFNEWYNREHTDERTQLPGFLRSRRYTAVGDTVSPKYMAWYETQEVDDLKAPGYLELLSDQTEWSKRIMGQFSLFQRYTLEVSIDKIFGFAGALSILRFTPPSSSVARETLRAQINVLLDKAIAGHGMVGGCLLENDVDVAHAPLVFQGKDIPEGDHTQWMVVVEGATSEACQIALSAFQELNEHVDMEALHYQFMFGTSR